MREIRSVMRRFLREGGRAVLDLMLPPRCPACGGPGDDLCRPCDQMLQRRPPPGCPRCERPMTMGHSKCPGDHHELANLALHSAPFWFAGSGGALVRRFKLDADVAAGRFLARAMAGRLRCHLGALNRPVLVPVPLHSSRRRHRGFDQAAWLAERIGTRLSLPVESRALMRTRSTTPQGDPTVTSRANNVEGAFAVRQRAVPRGRTVVLVDDVLTSGATARTCAAVLRAQGVRQVAILTACRS